LKDLLDSDNLTRADRSGLEHHAKRTVADDAIDLVRDAVSLHCVARHNLTPICLVLCCKREGATECAHLPKKMRLENGREWRNGDKDHIQGGVKAVAWRKS
jgi:hypothetical protein